MFWRSTVFINELPYQQQAGVTEAAQFLIVYESQEALQRWFRPTKQNILGWTRGKYRDKRTNQVQTTYGPEDQHGTWEWYPWKMNIIFQTIIGSFYVNFSGDISKTLIEWNPVPLVGHALPGIISSRLPVKPQWLQGLLWWSNRCNAWKSR